MLADGFHDVPDGKIAAVVTSLEMFAKPPPRPEADGLDWTLERLASPAAEDYLALYSAVGRDWLWFTRLVMPREALLAAIRDPRVEVWRLAAPGGETGILELDFRQPDTCELAYFGVSPGLVGGGAARWMMNRAVERAWSRPIRRFWVHTCTLDHPNAPRFYMRSGFQPFRREVEIADDPRLAGLAPLDSAPHIPVIRGDSA
ncbi:N-acetyltransferase [Phenylobacterium sp.]|uniref:GNAT family N-acetyltransferase n=1 Tax=Phenylobacterium sp. TaxID=1871053 RepID=UPI0025DD783D|nr:GNAT family N-acetyltransferase [Phenylobacterium sp.]MBX3484004.1 GNAT family N-acetyltransferase [Phenylobacterium sp.]MCW5760121.1 GNAT family N-acetyltransferase [Phenylobacterium sp.]